MPELPEVETIKLGLKKYLIGHFIESVDIKLKNSLMEILKRLLVQKLLI